MSALSEDRTARSAARQKFGLLRLNAITNPVQPSEEACYRRYGLSPERVEANTPQEILTHATQCDILFVVATALPLQVINGLEHCRLISRVALMKSTP